MIQADIPLRVRIGVVGHRRLSEPERIAAAVAEILQNRIFELFDKRVTGFSVDKAAKEPKVTDFNKTLSG